MTTPSTALEAGCRHGWEEAAGSSSLRLVANSKDRQRSLGLLCPVPGAVHEHLRAPGVPRRRRLPCPRPSGPAAAPRISPIPCAYPCPVLPRTYLLAADPSPGPLSAAAALSSAFSSVYVPALRSCVSCVTLNPRSAADVGRWVRPALRHANGAGASENRAHAPRGGPLPSPGSPPAEYRGGAPSTQKGAAPDSFPER